MGERYARGALVWGVALSGLLSGQTNTKIDFRRDVQPIFRANCYGCHGPSVQRNNFRLDRRSDAMRGGTIAQIGPGNAQASRLYLRLTGTQSGMQMPPTGPLQPDQIEKIKLWIDRGAEWPDDVSGEVPPAPPDPKATAMMTALRNGDAPAFRKALAESPSSAKRKGPGGSTPLMYATLYGDAASMQLLLDKGADANARNDAGATALMWAVDDLAKTRLLVEHGADVNARSDVSRTALLIACGIPGNDAVVRFLLDRGAKVAVKAPALGGDTTPLVEAAYAGNETIMRMLVAHGFDAKSAGPGALALSMRARCDGCMAMFLKEPAPDLVIPAMFIVSPPLGPALGVKALLEHGGDAHARGPDGTGILTIAAASDAFPVETVKALLDGGADINGKTPEGETALDLAKRHGHTPVVDFLVKAGAKEGDVPAVTVPPPKPAAGIRAAVERSLPLLEKNDAAFLKASGCVSCHNNTLAAVTMATARKSGFHVDEREVAEQLKTIGNYIESWRERTLQNQGIPGDNDTSGHILLGLAAANYPGDTATDAMAILLKREQTPDGHWGIFAHRPPLEASDIETTAVAMRALQVYAPKVKRAEYEKAVALAAAWLAKAEPRCTEDRVFQVLGLTWAGADKEAIRAASHALAAEQRPDGGWAQIPPLASDAYATGEALVALQQSGTQAGDAALQRGIRFLMNSQAEDGSWYVRRRALPLQPYFESGFPYGRDQFISASATNWATTALAMAAK
ncbi:MAG TPA: ankyrin repeat domain-containing protein [Bryobacteraceae bacterium]|nr:ankyrin repeat domain-containing protein [Bryobacteraceae bacterium]